MTVRKATQADLPAVQVIITKALPADYQWKYCFPARSSVKHDSSMYVQRALEQTLAPGNTDWLVCVTEDPGSRKPVGVASWSWTDARIQEDVDDNAASQGLTATLLPPAEIVSSAATASSCTSMPLLFTRSTSAWAMRSFFASMEFTWPKKRAPLCLQLRARPATFFFSGLGFADCGHVVVQVPGEKEEIGLKAMILAAPQQEKRRGSFLDMIGLGERRRSSDVRTSKS
ncbi:hypothetical protein K4K60_007071 [Colletotrichum sp. SAR11_57]|nr:hypothetical protein K4K60_007071 [Colletotrichum sp. SAR11_57]